MLRLLECQHCINRDVGDAITEQSAHSGFDIANRDLEIRGGAGSLLGTEQSDMAAKVGFDLYMRIKQEGIPRLLSASANGYCSH